MIAGCDGDEASKEELNKLSKEIEIKSRIKNLMILLLMV